MILDTLTIFHDLFECAKQFYTLHIDIRWNCPMTTKETTRTAAIETSQKHKVTAAATSPVMSQKHTKGQNIKEPEKIKEESKHDIIVIACSTVGAIILLIVIFLVVLKMKKSSEPHKLKEIATPSVDHKVYDARTFVNASFEET